MRAELHMLIPDDNIKFQAPWLIHKRGGHTWLVRRKSLVCLALHICLNSTCEISPSSGFSYLVREDVARDSLLGYVPRLVWASIRRRVLPGPQMRDICRMLDTATRALLASRPSIGLYQPKQSAPLVLTNGKPKTLSILLRVSPLLLNRAVPQPPLIHLLL
jgi:hypothetical protein